MYEGRCAELCGAGHALMNFRVIAEEQEDFDKWVASIKNPKSQPVNAPGEGRARSLLPELHGLSRH